MHTLSAAKRTSCGNAVQSSNTCEAPAVHRSLVRSGRLLGCVHLLQRPSKGPRVAAPARRCLRLFWRHARSSAEPPANPGHEAGEPVDSFSFPTSSS